MLPKSTIPIPTDTPVIIFSLNKEISDFFCLSASGYQMNVHCTSGYHVVKQ